MLEYYIKAISVSNENRNKETKQSNNYIMSFIRESKNFIKNHERNEISNLCIKYDNNALYAEGMFKTFYIKGHIIPKNDQEEAVNNCYLSLFNDYINGEIKAEKNNHELDLLYGKEELRKKIYLRRNFHIMEK